MANQIGNSKQIGQMISITQQALVLVRNEMQAAKALVAPQPESAFEDSPMGIIDRAHAAASAQGVATQDWSEFFYRLCIHLQESAFTSPYAPRLRHRAAHTIQQVLHVLYSLDFAVLASPIGMAAARSASEAAPLAAVYQRLTD